MALRGGFVWNVMSGVCIYPPRYVFRLFEEGECAMAEVEGVRLQEYEGSWNGFFVVLIIVTAGCYVQTACV